LCAVCFSLGLTAVIVEKNKSDSAHLYSLHSWLGLCALVLFVVQFWLFRRVSDLTNINRIPQSWHQAYEFMKIMTLVTILYTAINGITEKNASLSCSYTVTYPDNNPAMHYNKIPNGCKLSNGLGVVLFLIGLLTTFAVAEIQMAWSPGYTSGRYKDLSKVFKDWFISLRPWMRRHKSKSKGRKTIHSEWSADEEEPERDQEDLEELDDEERSQSQRSVSVSKESTRKKGAKSRQAESEMSKMDDNEQSQVEEEEGEGEEELEGEEEDDREGKEGEEGEEEEEEKGWQKAFHEGRPYYYNKSTGERTWDRPDDYQSE